MYYGYADSPAYTTTLNSFTVYTTDIITTTITGSPTTFTTSTALYDAFCFSTILLDSLDDELPETTPTSRTGLFATPTTTKRPQLETLPVQTTESGHFPQETLQGPGGLVLSGLSTLTEVPATPVRPTSTIGVPAAVVTTVVPASGTGIGRGRGLGWVVVLGLMGWM
jgi:hypothetical protein